MPMIMSRATAPLMLALSLTSCGRSAEAPAPERADMAAEKTNPGEIVLSADQIAAAGIQLGSPTIGGSATIEMPATIEGDPQATQIVSAAIGGRIVALTRNLGEPVRRGETVAVIESREAAQLKGEVEASRARLALATATLSRERRLFAERVSPEQDLIAARTAATEARIAFRQAQSQVSAAGGGGRGLNRLGITAPIAGRIIARPVLLGQAVAADTELYRIADLGRVSLAFNFRPEDAGRVRPGNAVTVTAPGRQARARIGFLSPALDARTRQVPVIATLDNRAGQWRVGEPVTASVELAGTGATDHAAILVPLTAVQTVDRKPTVFVRTTSGFRATQVVPGEASGGSVIIRSGLTGRERIATTGSFVLKAELGKGDAADEE